MELTTHLFARGSIARLLEALRPGHLSVNPIGLASSAFLLLSPFLNWITVVSVVVYQNVIVFGSAAQSTLLMVSSDKFGTNAPEFALVGADASILLLLSGGLLMFKSIRLGVALSLSGILAYAIPFYRIFGSESNGLQQTFISPGIGMFVAGTGVFLGALSSVSKPEPISVVLRSIKAPRSLAVLGASFGIIGITLDALNHTALGQFADFIGLTTSEQVIHLGLIGGIFALSVLALLRGKGNHGLLLFIVSGATLTLLGVDSVTSYASGYLQDFLGHNITETALHLSVYYGVAMAFIASILNSNRL